MPTVIHQLADAFLKRKEAAQRKSVFPEDSFMPKSSKQDLANRLSVFEQGGTTELLKQAGKEMYENPIVNTAISLTPGAGDLQSAFEAMKSAKEGDWTGAGLNAVGILPFVPALKTVWHGSPHTFEKFDLSKIGTGEGAQAYGHGLYLAEHPDVAKAYRSNLVENPTFVETKTGKKITPESPEYQDVIDRQKRMERNGYGAEFDKKYQIQEGALYKVDLPDQQIAKMLDWDKPMNQQSPELLKALGYEAGSVEDINKQADALLEKYGYAGQRTPEADKLFYKEYNALNDKLDRLAPTMTGGDFYRGVDEQSKLHNMLGGYPGDAARSAELLQQGIPGIQYLDQASRGVGDGTRNYVVFSDEIPTILERNGTSVFEFPK